MAGFYSDNLAGVEVGETGISDVRGEEGLLIYRGYPLEALVNEPFWRVVWLVIFGDWPAREEEEDLRQFMALHARLEKQDLELLAALPRDLHPMLMLQGMVPLLKLEVGMEAGRFSADAAAGLVIAARLPTLLAAWRQLELGQTPVAGSLDSGCHENFLTMFNGHVPSPDAVRVLDAVQILQMEHGFNAGTFAGRVCASTLAPIQSSISASIGTLFGCLHGGADQAALEMAEAIGDPGKAEVWVRESLREKRRIMGMGHREYRVVDPRAKLLKPLAARLCRKPEDKRLLDTLLAVEDACRTRFAEQGREIHANVEFFKGAVFHALGVPPHYFTALFAMARIYGYIAHFLEFRRDSCLIRPRARYVGRPFQQAVPGH